MDNLYYTTNVKSTHIIPVILYATLYLPVIKKNKLFINTDVDSPQHIPIDNYNTPTIIKTNSDMDCSDNKDNSVPMDCSTTPDNKMITVNSCPYDNDITMVEISNNEITMTDMEDNTDIVMVEMSEKKNDVETVETVEEYDITNNLKLYNTSIPLWVFIKNENIDLDKFNTIKIKYMFNNKIEIIDININANINRLLYELFNIVTV